MHTAPALNPLAILGNVDPESVTISADAMPHHFIARAVIFDLQPSHLVAAIMAVESEIKKTYPHAHTSGWRASSDGLRIYFYAWTAEGGRHVA